jgi:hypothetical protein
VGLDDAAFLEDSQVLQQRRKALGKGLRELQHRRVVVQQNLDHPAARGIRECAKSAIELPIIERHPRS